MSTDTYHRLRAFIDAVTPWGFPKTESGVEIEILKKLFTPQQAETVVHLKPTPEPAGVIAQRMGICEEEAVRRLEQMAEEALIVKVPARDGYEYKAIAFAPGIAEMKVDMLRDRDTAKLLGAYAPAHGASMVKPRDADAFRVLPVEESLSPGSEVLSYENSSEMIEKTPRPRAVMPCLCRAGRERRGKACGRVLDACVSFGPYARYVIDKGLGREMDDDAFRALLKRTEDEGLVHLIYNTASFEDTVWLCNCCSCCCDILTNLHRAYKGKIEGGVTPSSFIAAVDEEKCSGCGLCIESCQFTALVLEDGVSKVNGQRCAGCGMCVPRCPEEAISMARRKERDTPEVPRNIEELLLRAKEAKKAGKAP